MKIYDYSKATTLKDFFKQEFMDRLDLKNEQLTSLAFKRGKLVHNKFVRSVFTDFMKNVVQECIDNGTKFVGHGSFWFYIWIKRVPEKEIDRIVKSRIYKKVDLISSDFNIYNFTFYSVFLNNNRYRTVRISYDKYHEMVDRVNNGKRYSDRTIYRTYHHFMPRMMEKYPLLSREQIAMIIKEGCYQLQKAIVIDRRDVRIQNTTHKFSMTIYRHRSLRAIKRLKYQKLKNGSY